MAKQTGALRFIGRLANAVGYIARDGKGDGYAAARALAATVANPQTLAQMSQRMKLTPVQNFYRGLAGLLDHSWQGVKYGNPSRLHFYSQALKKLNESGVPYVNKGDRQFVPWKFPVSTGSIPAKFSVTNMGATGTVTFDIVGSQTAHNLGELSQAFIDGNLGLQNGDQLTFIFIYEVDGAYLPIYRRIVLDTSSEVTLSQIEGVFIALSTSEGTSFELKTDGGSNIEEKVVGAAMIVSRLSGNIWQRNNTTMAVAADIVVLYGNNTAFNDMLASYRTSKSTESDKYLNNGFSAEIVDPAVTILSATTRDITMTVDSVNGQSVQVAIATMSDGTTKALRSKDSSPMVIQSYAEGNVVAWENIEATADTLAAIQSSVSAVSGWFAVDKTSTDEFIPENRP